MQRPSCQLRASFKLHKIAHVNSKQIGTVRDAAREGGRVHKGSDASAFQDRKQPSARLSAMKESGLLLGLLFDGFF